MFYSVVFLCAAIAANCLTIFGTNLYGDSLLSSKNKLKVYQAGDQEKKAHCRVDAGKGTFCC